MSEERLRAELYASFKNRAMMVYHIYSALEEEIGANRAAEIMKRAIYGVEPRSASSSTTSTRPTCRA